MTSKTPQKGAWIGSFKPKRQNLYIAISTELLIRRTSHLRTEFRPRKALRGYLSHCRNLLKSNCFVGGPPLSQSKYNMADGRHLENRYDVIFQRRMFRFGQNLAARCRMARRLRRNGRDRNRRYNSNMADVCISKPEVVIYQPPIEISRRN